MNGALQQFELLIRSQISGQTPVAIADVFGCRLHLEKAKLQRLEEELLGNCTNSCPRTSQPQPKKTRTTHALDEFISRKPIPIVASSPPKKSLRKAAKKPVSPLKMTTKTKRVVTPPPPEQKLQITIDLPELDDPKTPKLMIQDIQSDLKVLLNKMRPVGQHP